MGRYNSLAPTEGQNFAISPELVGKRRLRAVVLGYLSKLKDETAQKRCVAQFESASCMSESLAAAQGLVGIPGDARDKVLGEFYTRAAANKEALVINKWFAMQVPCAFWPKWLATRAAFCVCAFVCACVCVFVC